VNTLVSYFTQMPDNDYRLSAARNSMSVLLEQPVFGVNGDVRKIVEAAGGAPHQSFYFIAVMYGVPAGICVLLMTWWIFAPKLPGKITLRNKQFPSADRCLAHAIGWVVLFLALSNNMSAGMLGWMCLGYACLPWVYSVPIRKNPKFEIRSTKQAVISDE